VPTYLIDGTTTLPETGDTGWGTTLNNAILEIDDRFTWSGSTAAAKAVAASGITGTTLASNVVTSSLTTVGTLGSLGVSGSATIGGNLTVTGDFTVNGTTTTINTTTLNVSDNVVVLNNDVTGSPSENAGIEVERGTSANVLIRWNETTDVWEFTTDGSAYSTFNAASAITGNTLASNVTGSSLTSVGTIGTGTWQGTAIAGQYGGTGVNNSGKTITLGGNLTTSGAYALTLTLSNTTSVTLPTTGTLATLAGSESLTNKKLGSLTSNGIVTTSGGDGTLSVTSTTGSGNVVLATSPSITTSLTTGSTTFDLVNTTATTVNFAGAATTLSIGAATGTTTVNNSLTVTGDLTVNGTTTTVNATTVTVDDKNIELGSVASPTNTTADGGGITLKGTTDKTFNWVNATAAWTSSEDLNLVSGKVYEINGTTVLSATSLGSGVTGSSLTSVGTLTSLTVSGATTLSGTTVLGPLSIDTQTGTTYTLALADQGKLVELNNASSITVTVPPNSSVAFPVGSQITFTQMGAGQVTFAAGVGVTIRSDGSKLKTASQYSMVTLVKRATDEWVLAGNLAV
jgi:hypothetical protein